eukprot:CAMPEP_0196581074 /NCGR_PEP_ID=MMETSP1081-20130531/32290_1 /TAXON_ID=36882 /ORGANISM="Pyramimonas amylifera, Strain CCMP720" /LENGTH=321 /DNA_ID=CAMNT_0041901171 /DNA_START=63 /DNA_END=1028 /DNA_ORIENTATION=+
MRYMVTGLGWCSMALIVYFLKDGLVHAAPSWHPRNFGRYEAVNKSVECDEPSHKETTNTATFAALDQRICDSSEYKRAHPYNNSPRYEFGVYYAQNGEDKMLEEKFWQGKRCGTFVELGGFTGTDLSNSLYFEETLGWRGVLIEAVPTNYETLRENRKNAINIAAAICPKHGFIEIVGKANNAGVQGQTLKVKKTQGTFVPCGPMGYFLHLVGIKEIDLFSIDVEGSELVVLDTMDWTIPVHVLLVELTGRTFGKSDFDDNIRLKLLNLGFVEDNDIKVIASGVFVNPNFPNVVKKRGKFTAKDLPARWDAEIFLTKIKNG